MNIITENGEILNYNNPDGFKH